MLQHDRMRDENADRRFQLSERTPDPLNSDISARVAFGNSCTAVPATPFYKGAISTTDTDLSAAQELRMLANLVLVVVHCRTASVCAPYSQGGYPVPLQDAGLLNIVHDLKDTVPHKKGHECTQVSKCAGNTIDAFEIPHWIHKCRLAQPSALFMTHLSRPY